MQEGWFPVLARKRSRESRDESWEEEAFAKDANAVLGGCVWPPYSYSCSFCKREFRSAQALGGHMNVHRRDRAKLKQVLTPINYRKNPHQTHFRKDQQIIAKNPVETREFCFDFQNPNHVSSIFHLASSSRQLSRDKNNGFVRMNDEQNALGVVADEEDEPISKKRRKQVVDEDEDEDEILEVNGLKSCSIQELDLELRLGDRPKT